MWMDECLQCDYCSALFKDISKLECHIRNHLASNEDGEMGSVQIDQSYGVGQGDQKQSKANIVDSDQERETKLRNNGKYTNTDKYQTDDSFDDNTANGYCSICGYSFAHCEEYQAHAEKEIVTMEILCTKCTLYFENREALEKHQGEGRCAELREIYYPDDTGKINTCKKCGKGAKDNDHLHYHKHYTENEDLKLGFKCGKCEKSFSQFKERIIHEEEHMNLTPFRCVICDSVFKRIERYNSHIKQNHQTSENTSDGSYKCEICGHMCNNAWSLLMHYKIHIDYKPFNCLSCPLKWTNIGYLRKHNRRVHATPVSLTRVGDPDATHTKSTADFVMEPYTCNKDLDKQDVNVSLSHSKENSVYKCGKCDKTFSQIREWSLHEETHLKYIFGCPCCKFRCRKVSEYQLHIETKHKNMENVYDCNSVKTCTSCTKVFNTVWDLLIHFKEHIKERPYKCFSCPRKYVELKCLRKHKLKKHAHKKTVLQGEIGNHIGKTIDYSKSFLKPFHCIKGQTMADKSQSGEMFPFTCGQCGQLFSQFERLWTHENTHRDLKPFRCVICASTFTSEYFKDHIMRHERSEESGETGHVYKCSQCTQVFDSAWKLSVHDRIHRDRSPFKCFWCPAKFSLITLLKHHMLDTHFSSQTLLKTHTCSVCSKMFSTKTGLLLHKITHSECICLVCNSKVTSITQLKHHFAGHLGLTLCPFCNRLYPNKYFMKTHIPCNSSPFWCHTCDDNFPDIKSQRHHLSTHVPEEILPTNQIKKRLFLCEICGYTCGNRTGFIKHQKTRAHRISRESGYFRCNKCVSYHNTAIGLQKHQYVHHNKDKPFKCKACPKRCASKISLQVHEKQHKKGFERKVSFNCNKCEKSFNSKNLLLKHSNIHMSASKPHKCDQCEVAFAQKCNLTKHKIIHTGEKPYKCDKCQAAFSHRSNLNKHYFIHTGDYPFRCDICSRGFVASRLVKEHWKTHSKAN